MGKQQVLRFASFLRSASQLAAVFGLWVGISALAPTLAAEQPAPGVDLDRLLHLPDSYEVGGKRIAGASAADWRARFRGAHTALEDARRSLTAAQKELGTLAEDSSQYQVAAPGMDIKPGDSPMSFRLRQTLRRRRAEVEERQRELRDLGIRADLADVPPEWRHPPIEGE